MTNEKGPQEDAPPPEAQQPPAPSEPPPDPGPLPPRPVRLIENAGDSPYLRLDTPPDGDSKSD